MVLKKSFLIIGILLLTSLSFYQISYFFNYLKDNVSFYPNWTVNFEENDINIYNKSGTYIKFNSKNKIKHDSILFKKQSNFFYLFFDTYSGDNVKVDYCENCFLLDLNNNIVYTLKDEKKDIVLKRKLVEKGFKVEKIERLLIEQGNEVVLLDAINNVGLVMRNVSKEIISLQIDSQQFFISRFTNESSNETINLELEILR